MTVHVPGEPPLEDLFLCLLSNVSPWTYLGARPVNPSPEASFEAGLDLFAMGRMGPLRMLRTLRQTLARTPDAAGPRRAPPARPGGTVGHRVPAAGLAGRRRPPRDRDRPAGAPRAGRAARRGLK